MYELNIAAGGFGYKSQNFRDTILFQQVNKEKGKNSENPKQSTALSFPRLRNIAQQPAPVLHYPNSLFDSVLNFLSG